MKAELLKHSNFVILTILGEFLVKLCFTVFTFENRGGWFRFINSEQYHFRGNNTTSGETIPLPGLPTILQGLALLPSAPDL